MSTPDRTLQRARRARVRITGVTVALLVLVLVVASAAALAGFRADLVEQLDSQLRRVALQADRAYEAGVLDAFAGSSSDPDLDLSSDVDEVDDLVAQLVDEDGELVYASSSLEGDPALWSPGEDLGPSTARSESLGEMRIVAIPLDTSWLVLGQPLAPIDDDVRALRHVLLVALLPTMVLVGLITWAAVGRALAPVVAAAAREERLLADVSHELRSPIAGLRALVESSGDPGGGEQERADLLANITRLETLTSQLLSTAHVDGAPAPARPVDVDEIVEREARRLAIGTTVHLDRSGVVAGQVVGVERDLESAVSNLMANAVRHADREVRLAVTEVDGWVEVVVADDGPGIDPRDRERVFERFTRLDEARGREDGGAGLGLAITRDVVTAHGGTIAVTDAPGGGATFVVRLPAAASGPDGHGGVRRAARRLPSR